MTKECQLESMPAELKIALLQQMPDIDTLSTLNHASPVFHAVYLANREDILTKTTLRELSTKNQPLNIDELLKPASLCHFVTRNGELDPNLEFAIRACQAQANKTTDIKLTVDSCIALRTLCFYYGWVLARPLESEPDQHLVICRKSGITYEEWSDPIRDCCLHVLVLGDYEPHEFCRFRYRSPGVGKGPEAWLTALALVYLNYPATTTLGRVWISGDGTPATVQESP